jgi:thioredoxin reductase (NADPH)
MRPLKNLCEIIVIGGGIAGLAAARHAARLGRSVTLFEPTGLFGGLVATTGEVEGLPLPGKFSGQDLAIHLLQEARKAGVQTIEAGVASVRLDERIALIDQKGNTYYPGAIIVASGASPRKLNVPLEDEFIGRGVSRCATCDGGFFRGQDVVVVGGGDAAAQEALVLSGTSRRVILVCRGPLRAKRDHVDKLVARENISFIWDSEVGAILGDAGVSGVRLRNIKTGASSDIGCAGLFPFIGSIPSTGFLPTSLLVPSGHIRTHTGFESANARLFAAGAARAGYGGNIVEAMAEGIGSAQAAAAALLH